MKALVALVLVPLAASAAAAAAQEPPDPLALEYRGVPRRVAERIVAVFEDPATTRWEGGRRLEAGEVVTGNVAARGGLVVVAGRIEGELVVLDGDVEFLPGGVVAGDVTVVRGEVRGVGDGSIGGTLLVYGRAEREADRGWERERERERWGFGARWGAPPLLTGDARLVLTLRPNYNRVEGLPVAIGPRITTSGRYPLRVEALAILRTEDDRPLSGDQVGYSVRAEQFLGGGRELRIGLAARSVVSPIESWQVTDLEASLATFLLHSDQRDYLEREGWSAYARYTPRRLPLDVTLEYRDEEHGLAAVADPWTLFGSDPWRPQPLVAEGSLRSLVGEATLDLRGKRDRTVDDGWYVSARLHRGLSGDLRIPELFLLTSDVEALVPGTRADETFTAGFLDVRRYNRVGPAASLDLRAVVGGSLTESALPPQFQHALGGAGSLPGYGLLRADCGARDMRGTLDAGAASPVFFPRYGCDRFALFQAEYRGGLAFDFSWADDEDDSDDWDWGFDWDGDLTWSLFFDAARGWAFDGASPAPRRDTGTLYDVGAGLVFDDDVGVYAAVPLNGDKRNLRVFLRLSRRF